MFTLKEEMRLANVPVPVKELNVVVVMTSASDQRSWSSSD